eukprot:m.43099 g.43099  ORF g.43099 m.43099 type:complete len:995 (+) comp7091_c0_seq1:193-3177(+)
MPTIPTIIEDDGEDIRLVDEEDVEGNERERENEEEEGGNGEILEEDDITDEAGEDETVDVVEDEYGASENIDEGEDEEIKEEKNVEIGINDNEEYGDGKNGSNEIGARSSSDCNGMDDENDDMEDKFLQKFLNTSDVEEDIVGDVDEDDVDVNEETKDAINDVGYVMDDDDYCETDLEDYSEDEVDIYDFESVYLHSCEKNSVRPLKRILDQANKNAITLTRTCLGLAQCNAIATSFEVHMELKAIDFSDCQLCGEGIFVLLTNLSSHEKLESINLSKNHLDMKGMDALATLLANNSSIRNLTLQATHIDEHLFARLAPALEKCCVSHLDFSENQLGEQSGMLLKTILESNSQIQHLNVSWNAISLRGAKAIASALCLNTSLKSLDAGWNGFADEGAESLAKMLRDNSTLDSLDISNNRITTKGFSHIAKALSMNSTLTSLRIAKNHIDEEGMELLVNTLSSENTTLHFVDAESIPVSQELSTRIAALTTPSKIFFDERGKKRKLEQLVKALKNDVCQLIGIDKIKDIIAASSSSTHKERYIIDQLMLALNVYSSGFLTTELSNAFEKARELEMKMFLVYCGFCGGDIIDAPTMQKIEHLQDVVFSAYTAAIKAYVTCNIQSQRMKAAFDAFCSVNKDYSLKFYKRLRAGYISECIFQAILLKYLQSNPHPAVSEHMMHNKLSQETQTLLEDYTKEILAYSKRIFRLLPNSKFALAQAEYCHSRQSNSRDNRDARIAASHVLNANTNDEAEEDDDDAGDLVPVPPAYENIAKMKMVMHSAKKAGSMHPKEVEIKAKEAALKTLQECSLSGVDADHAMYRVLQKTFLAYVHTKLEPKEFSSFMRSQLENTQLDLETIEKKIDSSVQEAHESGHRPLLHITTDAITDGSFSTRGKSAWDILEKYMIRHEFSLVDIFKQLDEDHTGFIAKEAFLRGIMNVGVHLTEKEVEGMLEQEGINETHDGKIEYFRICKRRALKRMATKEMIEAAKKLEEKWM